MNNYTLITGMLLEMKNSKKKKKCENSKQVKIK